MDVVESDSLVVALATTSDVAAMASLAAARRLDYAKAQPTFWKIADDALERHTGFLTALVESADVVVLVARQRERVVGFAVGSLVASPPVYDPGGLTGLVDDFVLDESANWLEVGRALFVEVRRQLAARGAVQIVVVCGHHDAAKLEALTEFGLSRASEWLVAPIDDESPSP